MITKNTSNTSLSVLVLPIIFKPRYNYSGAFILSHEINTQKRKLEEIVVILKHNCINFKRDSEKFGRDSNQETVIFCSRNVIV